MKFLTGARWNSGQISVISEDSVFNPMGQRQIVPGARVYIKKHKIDTDDANHRQAFEKRDDFLRRAGKDVPENHTKNMVEDYLLKRTGQWRSDGRGIHVDTSDTLANIKLASKDLQKVCSFTWTVGDEVQQCSEKINHNAEFCDVHEEIVRQAVEGNKQDATV